MNFKDAADILIDAITGGSDSLTALTTAPSEEQREALGSILVDDIAPTDVCAEVDLDPGSTWGAVCAAILRDVG